MDSKSESSTEAFDSSLAERRLALDIQKLELELTQLAAPWWRRPSFWLAALPTALASITVVYGLSNGYFDAVSVKLENEKSALEAEIKKFNQERDKIKIQIAVLDKRYSQLSGEVEDRLKSGACGFRELGTVENDIRPVRPSGIHP